MTCQHGRNGMNRLAKVTDRTGADQALNQLLTRIAPKQAKQTTQLADDIDTRLDRCVELVKAEASQAAALIADCAPHGRPTLAQAQSMIESLESLQKLGSYLHDHGSETDQ